MSGQLGELVVSLAADIARFREDMGKAAGISQQTSQKMASNFERMATTTQNAMKLAAGSVATLAIADFARDVVNAGLAAERMTKMFAAGSLSVAQGAREMEYIRGVANKMGLDFQATAESYAKFLSAIKGTSAEGEKGRQIFEGISTALSALGKSPEETGRVFNQIQQSLSKGKIELEDMKIIAEAGVPIFTLLSKSLGTSKTEIFDMMSKGKLMAEDVWPKLSEEMRKAFAEFADKGAKSAQAEINRMNNAWLETKQILGEGVLPLVASLSVGIRNASKETSNYIKGMKSDLGNLDFLNAFNRTFKPFGETGNDISARLLRQRYGALGQPGPVETGKYTTLASHTSQLDAEAAKAAEEAKKRAEEFKKAQEEIDRVYKSYSSAMDGLNKEIRKTNPYLTEHDEALGNINDKIDSLVSTYPQYTKSLEEARTALKQNLDLTEQMAKAVGTLAKVEADTAFATAQGDFTSLKYRDTLQYKPRKNEYSLLGQGYTGMGTSGRQEPTLNFSEYTNLFGSQEDKDFQYTVDRVAQLDDFYSQGVISSQEYYKKLEEEYKGHSDRMAEMEMQRAMQAASIMGGQMSQLGQLFMQGSKDQFEAGKALAIAGATIDTAAAAISAYKAMAGIPVVGPYLGAAAAAMAITYGVAQIAMIESASYSPRAMGGAVNTGMTYLVGEKGPELLTMGGNGYITPNSQIGNGQNVTVTNVFQVSTGVSETVRADLARFMPAIEARTVAAVQSAINNGTSLTRAVGRM